MNLPLSDPLLLAQDIPETLTARLRSSGQAVCIRFSHAGDLLASGTAKGTIAIFDLETNGVARKLKGHTAGRTVQSLSWEKSGRYLLSSSIDWKVILWDLKTGQRVRSVSLGAPVYIAELHPRDHLRVVAALYEYRPVLADLTDARKVQQYPLPNLPKRAPHELLEAGEKADAKHFTTVAAFTPTGSHIITGTTKGWLNVIHTESRTTVYSTRLCSKPILLIRLSSSGRDLLVNASDTIIRTIKLPDLSDPNLQADSIRLDVEHKFQDVVNRLSWNHVAFSSNADYVMASTLMNHDIYIWERGHGSLVKILEGPKEELGAVEASFAPSTLQPPHPISSQLLTCVMSVASHPPLRRRHRRRVRQDLPLVHQHAPALVRARARLHGSGRKRRVHREGRRVRHPPCRRTPKTPLRSRGRGCRCFDCG